MALGDAHIIQGVKEGLGHGRTDRQKRIESRQGLPSTSEPGYTPSAGTGERLGEGCRSTGSWGLEGGGANEGGGRGRPQSGGEGLDLGESVLQLRVLQQRLPQHELLVGEQGLSLLPLCSLSYYTLHTYSNTRMRVGMTH